LGFVGDVGDLAKLVVAENGKHNIANSKEKLEHELADCLWSVIVLAYVHGVDLESSFTNTMNELEKHLSEN
jgi:NTP pyrophosphatase (non-canonical NTP hydrolase)